MTSVNRFRISIVACLLGLSTFAFVACGCAEGETTTTTVLATSTTAPESVTTTSVESGDETSGKLVEVPALNGLQETEAKATLAAVGLESVTSPVYSLVQSSWGFVVGQDPPSGTLVPSGTAVTIQVRTEGILVPHLVGLTKGDAEDTLVSVGLTSAVVYQSTTNSAYWGKVLLNEPAYNQMVPPGSTVTLTIGKKPFSLTTTTTLIKITVPSTPLSVP